jgi:transglutaminase-like putative cysteine protease
MPIDISVSFSFFLDQATDILLQFEAAHIPEQRVLSQDTRMDEARHIARVPAQDTVGERIWLRAEGEYNVSYTAQVEVDRMLAEMCDLPAMDPHQLPGEAVGYLFDSRYCAAERMQNFVQDRFGHVSGGERIIVMRDWVARNFTYTPGSSTSATTALDTFVDRRGICRDYAHVMISLARASTIPARFVSCYAPGVTPQDFHAVAEVFLTDPTVPGGGAWHIVDATGMADPAQTVKIGVGRDAADVSFLTSFGYADFRDKSVEVVARD